uniref:Uncharacterized protein n=1 Tax=Romanomermis culicivorax TaxID=13658 RepID=A0A915IES7_ROMCU
MLIIMNREQKHGSGKMRTGMLFHPILPKQTDGPEPEPCSRSQSLAGTLGAKALLLRNDIVAFFAGQALMVWECEKIVPKHIFWYYQTATIM